MIYFVSYTYLDPRTGERCFENTIADFSEFLGLSDIRDFEDSVTKELLKKESTGIVDPILEKIKHSVTPGVKIICINKC